MRKRWYSDGLRFECTQCGDCCTGAPGYVWMGSGEIRALAEFLGISADEFGARFLRKVGRRYSLIEKQNGDCIFYDGGCTVYPDRPRQCRTFPFWTENLRSRGAWDEAASECPGMDHGRFYPVDAIERIRSGDEDASLTEADS